MRVHRWVQRIATFFTINNWTSFQDPTEVRPEKELIKTMMQQASGSLAPREDLALDPQKALFFAEMGCSGMTEALFGQLGHQKI